MNIADLPSDIVCKIITFGQESIESSRLISHRWNRLVVSHLDSPKSWQNLPPINYLRWDIGRRENILFISVPGGCANYFGIECSAFEITPDDIPNSDCKPDSVHRSAKIRKRKVPKFQHLFNRCSMIERLELSMVDIQHSRHVANLLNALQGVKVSELVIPEPYIHPRDAKTAILNILGAQCVQSIILCGWNIHASEARITQFVQSLKGLVKSVEIVEVYSPKVMGVLLREWKDRESLFNRIAGMHARLYFEHQKNEKITCGLHISLDDAN